MSKKKEVKVSCLDLDNEIKKENNCVLREQVN